MPASYFRGEYEKLAQLARTFSQQSQAVVQLLNNLKQKKESLQNGGWLGQNASQFYAEVDASVFPSLKRAAAAMEQGAKAMQAISKIIKQAEMETAALFKAQMEGGSGGGGGGGSGGKSGGGLLSKLAGFGKKALGFVGDLFIGAGQELWDMVKGIGNLIIHPVDTLKGLWYGITHPKELWEAFKKPYVEDWNNGHPGRAIGRGLMFVGSLLLGTKGADKAGKVAGAAGKAGELGKAGRVAGWMESLSTKIKAGFTSKPVQTTRDATRLWQMADEALPALRSMTDDLAAKTGGRAEVAALKDLGEATKKVMGDYKGDFSQLKDVARSRVVYKSLDDAYKGLEAFYNQAKKDGSMVYFKDRFIEPTASGFRDVLMNVKMPNGHIAELRLTTEAMEKVAKLEHAATYQPIRDILRAAGEQGRPLTTAEEASIAAMRAQWRPAYEAAWQELTQGIRGGSNIPQALGQAGVTGEILDTANEAYNDRTEE